MSMYGKKPLQYCKVISLQLIKINENKNKKLKSLIGFLSANKIDDYNRAGGRGQGKKRKMKAQKLS